MPRKLLPPTQQQWVPDLSGKVEGSRGEGLGTAFHLLCSSYGEPFSIHCSWPLGYGTFIFLTFYFFLYILYSAIFDHLIFFFCPFVYVCSWFFCCCWKDSTCKQFFFFNDGIIKTRGTSFRKLLLYRAYIVYLLPVKSCKTSLFWSGFL